VIGSPLATPSVGTSKRKPCGCWSGTLGTPVKSGPTSGPLTDSSQAIHVPQGICPPEQAIMTPFRLVYALTTSPCVVTSIVVVPARAIASYAFVASPNGGPGLFSSWFRRRITLPSGPGNAPIPSWRPGRTVPSSRTATCSVSWNER
jgi:hypothetical protein